MRERENQEFAERVIDINRVTRVVKGGKRLRFRTLVIIGNQKNQVGFGIGKASDVSQSIGKAIEKARRNLQTVTLTAEGTLPYPVEGKFKKARVLVKPAPPGTGVIAGGAIRVALELAGVKNVVSKALGSGDKVSNTVATIQALSSVIDPKLLRARRGKEVEKAVSKKTGSPSVAQPVPQAPKRKIATKKTTGKG